LNNLSDKIYDFILEIGLDPIYLSTIFVLLAMLIAYHLKFKNWNKLKPYDKRLFVTSAVATLIILTISLIKLVRSIID